MGGGRGGEGGIPREEATETSPVAPPAALQGLLPEVRQRSRPSRGRHSWPGLQVLWRQEMLLCVEQVQSLEHVLSGYQLSPTCGTWASAEPREDRKPASD